MESSKLTPAQVKAKIDAGERVTFLDVRSPAEWDTSDAKLPGALRVPPAEAGAHLAELRASPPGATIVTYCA
jgi:rhodanese-related sulfurtransferase